ncbi:MAG: hypothetical protein ACTTID_02410 [Bacillales bacterium]
MEIHAKVRLNLPKTLYKLTLKYNTFEKATYDSYIIACLVANTKKEEQAYKYIDEITGKGSLNSHFKKLYDSISKFTKDQINDILVNSLFPITVINKEHCFEYYQIFDVTKMGNKVYEGNLIDNLEDIRKIILPVDKDIKFVSLDYIQEDGELKRDNYNAIFSKEGIKVDLLDGKYCSISKEDFSTVYKNDIDTLDGYLGSIGETISDGNWNVLSKEIINTFKNERYKFNDSKGRHCVLTNDFIKTYEIIKVFDLYFYKRNKFMFDKNSKALCEDAVEYLFSSKNINEYKTKYLINLLSYVDDKIKQQVVQYILDRKDSKEISQLGLSLIKSGLEKGWEKDILISIKKQISSSDLQYLYRLNKDLGFEVEDLLNIDKTDLNEEDLKKINKYLCDKENILRQINLWIGEITNSGIREQIKALKKSDLKIRVKKFVDKRTGHNKLDYKSMDMNRLKKEYEEIKYFYNEDFNLIKKEISKLNVHSV